jgi:hypothetical protein
VSAPQPERWLPLAEAAAELGISTDTARRRLRKHQLVGEQRPTPQGFTWWVCLGAAAEVGSPPPPHAAQVAGAPRRPAEAGVAELVGLVDRLQSDLVAKAEAAAMWQARAEFLASQLEQAQLALSAPKEATSQERPFLGDSEGVSVEPTQPAAVQTAAACALVDAVAAFYVLT